LLTPVEENFKKNIYKQAVSAISRNRGPPAMGPILLVSDAQLGIRKERGTRDKPSQWLNKVARNWLDTGLPEKGKGR
jgi:hypothetical protein